MKNKGTLILIPVFCLLLLSCSSSDDIEKRQDTGEAAKTPFTLTVYDAGKGDAFLLSGRGLSLLMDCGYKDCADEILFDMAGRGIDHLDLMIISHFDKDHVGGASKILKKFPVSRVITTRRTNDDKRTEKFFETLLLTGLKNEVPEADINIDMGDFHILISPPLKKFYPDSEDNNSSLLVRVSSSYGTVLFTGDAEKDRVEEILLRDDLKCDLLKIPHHGTESWKLPELLRKTSPDYAVITSSPEEPADEEVLSLLSDRGITCYNTADTGQFELVFDEKGIYRK